MNRVTGIVLAVIGLVLLIWGLNEADSLASRISKFFTGSPTDHAVWMILVGVAALAGGVAMAALGGKSRNAL
jgi:hypothetical protein